jgi:hypothetical protein
MEGYSMSRFQSLVTAPALAALTGCGSLALSAIHDPLYRAAPHTSTITATADDFDKGVSEIRIDVVEGAGIKIRGYASWRDLTALYAHFRDAAAAEPASRAAFQGDGALDDYAVAYRTPPRGSEAARARSNMASSCDASTLLPIERFARPPIPAI